MQSKKVSKLLIIFSTLLIAINLLKGSFLDWTFICSPNIVNENSNFSYITCEDSLPENNENEISLQNLADCLINCIEKNIYLKKKIGITNIH